MISLTFPYGSTQSMALQCSHCCCESGKLRSVLSDLTWPMYTLFLIISMKTTPSRSFVSIIGSYSEFLDFKLLYFSVGLRSILFMWDWSVFCLQQWYSFLNGWESRFPIRCFSYSRNLVLPSFCFCFWFFLLLNGKEVWL